MDDDTKRYTIQVKGKAYKFLPIDLDAIARLQVIGLMEPSAGVTTKATLSLIKNTMLPEDWDDLANRFMRQEIDLKKELGPIFDKLLKRTVKDLKAEQEPDADDDGE